VTTVTNQNYIHEEIKSRLNSRNICYHAVKNILSSHPIFKNVNIKIYKTIILPPVLHGCETWSLTLKDRESSKTGCCGEYMDLRNRKL
jgi:hypothetical protein